MESISDLTKIHPKVMKKLLLTTLLAGASLLTSHAAIIAEDSFTYTAGTQLNGANGGTGWTTAWTAQADRYEIQAANQTYPGLNTSGGTAVSKFDNASFGNGFSRSFASTTGRVWGSATITFAQVPTYFEFKLNETTNVNWSAKFGFNGGNIFTEHSGPGALVNTAFAAATGTTYFLAFTYDTSGGSGGSPTTFYVNPTGLGSGSAPSGSVASASFTGNNYAMSGTNNLSMFAGNGLFTIDDVRLGTTWASVSPIPEPSAFAALAGISVLGMAALRRRRRSV